MASLSSGNTLSLQGLIASGEFSAVFLAHRSKDTELTVVKCFSRERSSADDHAERRVQSEKFALSLISQISHPFVVQFRYVHYDNDQLFLGMEHVGGCAPPPTPPALERVVTRNSCATFIRIGIRIPSSSQTFCSLPLPLLIRSPCPMMLLCLSR